MPRKYDLEFKLEAVRMASEVGVTLGCLGSASIPTEADLRHQLLQL